jgi:hypothetical protein
VFMCAVTNVVMVMLLRDLGPCGIIFMTVWLILVFHFWREIY